MNIKITYNWLLDYLETDADPYEIQKYLSLCGPSIERVDKVGDDYVFDIEITSNRVDMASVFGIALECSAILPQFNKKAKLKFNPLEEYNFKNKIVKDKIPELNVSIIDDNICSRFTIVLLKNIKINESSEVIKTRLNLVDIKSINNVVDISNYLMISLGQPTHIFDYDKIVGKKMIMRLSKKGEEIETLDGKKIILPGQDIVMEDESGKLIDLCGIMGGLSSCVSAETKNILVFAQNYNKSNVRKTSMITAQRTVACTYFEKGLDEERVETTIAYAISLLKEHSSYSEISDILDIYPNSYKNKKISLTYEFIDKKIGVKISSENIKQILNSLGFTLEEKNNLLEVSIPSYRNLDINIPEDIVEEVARIYGYFNLPSKVQTIENQIQPKDIDDFYQYENKIKYYLKHQGLNEFYNYSMISKEQIENCNLKIENHIKIKNTISTDIEYMRTSLLPSIIKNIKDNEGKKDELQLFEIANVYHKKNNDLPEEIKKIIIAGNTNYLDIKTIVESLYREYNIEEEVIIQKVKPTVLENFGIKKQIYFFETDFKSLVSKIKKISKFIPINHFAQIKLDKSFEIKKDGDYKNLIQKFKSEYLDKFELIDSYKNKITIRFYFSKKDSNIVEEDAKKELEKISN